jgi:hypothetical protein
MAAKTAKAAPVPCKSTRHANPVELLDALDAPAPVAVALPDALAPVVVDSSTGPDGTATDTLYPDGTLLAAASLVLCAPTEKSEAVADGGRGLVISVGVLVLVPALLRIAVMAEDGGLLTGTLEMGCADCMELAVTAEGFWRFSDSPGAGDARARARRVKRRRGVWSLRGMLEERQMGRVDGGREGQ